MSHNDLPSVAFSSFHCLVTSPPKKQTDASRSPLVAGADFRSPRRPLSATTRNSRCHEMARAGAWLPKWELDSHDDPAAAAASETKPRRKARKRPDSEVPDGKVKEFSEIIAESRRTAALTGTAAGNDREIDMDGAVSPACVLTTAAREALAMAATDGCFCEDAEGMAGRERAGYAFAEAEGQGVVESERKVVTPDACGSPSLQVTAAPVLSTVEAELDQRREVLGGMLAVLRQRMSALRALAGGEGSGESGVEEEIDRVVDGREEDKSDDVEAEEEESEDGDGAENEERRDGEVNDWYCDSVPNELQYSEEALCRETGVGAAAAGSMTCTESSATVGSVIREGHAEGTSLIDLEPNPSFKGQDEKQSECDATCCASGQPTAAINDMERLEGVCHEGVELGGKEVAAGEGNDTGHRPLGLPCVLSDDSDDDQFFDLPTSPTSLVSGPSSPQWLLQWQSASSSASSLALAPTEPVLEAGRLHGTIPLSRQRALPLQFILWVISCCSRRRW
ncbi:unnamed protein product [Closterium sp. NIES-53]